MSTSDRSLGRSIRLFLVEGAATGLIIAEIVNWTGKAIVVPRAALGHFLSRPEALNPGVYFLSGSDPEEPLRSLIYIGESESVGQRLRDHDKDDRKEFFERAVVFVSKDENLTKAHARYLEGRLVAKVRDADRSKCLNGTEPGLSPLPEADRSDMEYFLSQLELVLPVLGLDVLRPQSKASRVTSDVAESSSSPDFPVFMMLDLGVNAEAQEINNEFVIREGSLAREKTNIGVTSTTSLLRKQFIDDGTFVIDGHQLRLTRDVALSSPSKAANVLYGGNVNGRWYWKEKLSGKSYGDWREEMLSQHHPSQTTFPAQTAASETPVPDDSAQDGSLSEPK